MGNHTKGLLALVAAFTISAPVLAEPVEEEAVIISQSNGSIAARTRQGDVAIAVTGATEIRERDGLSRRTRDLTSLIPGLIIKIEGDRQGDTITAAEIEYRERDWRTAVATRAGTIEEFDKNAEQLAELKQAIIDGQEYVVQQEATVYFASGSTSIVPDKQAELRTLASQAPSFGNYRVSILGYADPNGDAAANERLSMRRADAVGAFLRQTGSIEPGRVLAPSAMGEGALAPGEAVPTSDAEARRVVVRVITPKTQLSN